MMRYHHALVLVHDEKDGVVLLNHAADLARDTGVKLTVCHIDHDWRTMNYGSDSLWNDYEAKTIIASKEMLSRLAKVINYPIDTAELITLYRFDDVEKFIVSNAIDLVIVGHRNRFAGVLTSESMEYINHLAIDVLIKHIKTL